MRSTRKHRSKWLRGTLIRYREIRDNVACVLAILLRGLQGLWSPCIGIRAPYPYANVLALALALALATTLVRHHLPLRRLISEPRGKVNQNLQTVTEKPQRGWRRTNTGMTQAKTGGD